MSIYKIPTAHAIQEILHRAVGLSVIGEGTKNKLEMFQNFTYGAFELPSKTDT